MKIKNNNYIDITKSFIKNACPNSHLVEERNYFEYKGEKYVVDGKKVVMDYSEEERRVAEWLENIFGGEIYLLPRINEPEGIKTPDYLWNHEYWNLKTIKGNGRQTLYHSIYKSKGQSENFILDISKSNLDICNTMMQLNYLYSREDTFFINKIIIKKNNKIIVIYKRK